MQVIDANGNMFGYDHLEIIGADGKPKTPGGGGGPYVPYTGATANVDLGEYELKAGQLSLDITPTGTAAVGTTRWNDAIGSSQTTLKGGSVILKNGVDLVARVVNKVTPNTTLTKAGYAAVRVSGAQGQRLAVAYAQANNDNNSADTIGLVTETIATNQEGFIITVGNLEEINTTGSLQGETWADGDVLYLSPTIPGAITNVKPTGLTGHIVVMGYVEYAHAIHGKIYVKIMNGWELDELHNVYINPATLANNDLLQYYSASQLWKNESLSSAGVQPTLSLTTTGTSGPATLVGSTLNVPEYTGGSGGTFGTHIVVKPKSGVYYSSNPLSGSGGTTTATANFYYLAPFIPQNTLVINEMRVEVLAAAVGGLATMLIFDDLNGLPKNKLLESTNIDCSTTGMKTFTTSFTFTAGTTYWLGMSVNANIGFRSNNTSFALQHHASSSAVNVQYFKAAAFGSVPSSITISPNSDASALQPITLRFRQV